MKRCLSTRYWLPTLTTLLFAAIAALAWYWPKNTSSVPAGQVRHDALKIEILSDGLYRLTLADLQAAGLAIDSLTTDNLAFSEGGTAVPYLLHQESLIFYGQAPIDRYTAVRPYWLTAGQAGLAMAQAAAPAAAATATLTQIPQTRRLEENNLYVSEARTLDDDADLWLWQNLPQREALPITFHLPALGSGPATVRLALRGVTQNASVEADHDLDLVINQQLSGTFRFDGNISLTSELTVPDGRLQLGSNELILDNTPLGASFLDIVQVNWLELDYLVPPTAVNDQLQIGQSEGTVYLTGFSGLPLLFDLANPTQPTLLTAWEYTSRQARLAITPEMRVTAVGPLGFNKPAQLTPVRQSTWHSTHQQADLLILTTDELASALAPLVEARQAAGLTVALVPVAEIYDEFGFGVATPASIQAFVRYAVQSWPKPRPRYLFLVGDASADYRNYLGLAPRNIVPSPMVPVQFSGETVSDSRLADINEDMRPDLAVGRWPVSTVAEVESLVQRTLHYEQATAVDRILFAADGTETQFVDTANRITQASQFSAEKVAVLSGPPTSELVAQWNQGAWLTTYIGHGSLDRWGKEDIFDLAAVDALAAATPSIVIQLTCLSGLFAHPRQISLTETMLTSRNGPVLTIAATSLTLSIHQEPFAVSLFRSLQDPSIVRIGDAFQAAKLSLDVANDPSLREISDTFALFGDPSAQIARPES